MSAARPRRGRKERSWHKANHPASDRGPGWSGEFEVAGINRRKGGALSLAGRGGPAGMGRKGEAPGPATLAGQHQPGQSEG